MKVIHDQLEICVDCLMFTANGEVQSDGRDVTAEHAEKMRARWGEQLINLHAACPEECDGWFSRTPCDGCGSLLGGERHPAVVLGED